MTEPVEPSGRDRANVHGSESARPIIPVDAPDEPVVRSASTIALWLAVLAGPALWITHFVVVYLLAEATCEAAGEARLDFMGPVALEATVAVVTMIAALAAVCDGWFCLRRSRDEGSSPLLRVGVLLAALSMLSILAVGGPALVLEPC